MRSWQFRAFMSKCYVLKMSGLLGLYLLTWKHGSLVLEDVAVFCLLSFLQSHFHLYRWFSFAFHLWNHPFLEWHFIDGLKPLETAFCIIGWRRWVNPQNPSRWDFRRPFAVLWGPLSKNMHGSGSPTAFKFAMHGGLTFLKRGLLFQFGYYFWNRLTIYFM